MSASNKTVYDSSASDVPVISIGMPIFNAGGYLRKAVFSIIEQTFRRWELIIIDDASTDGALDSIRDLNDPRIRIVRGNENRGLATRLNEAVALALGQYFARMDQDDISHPDRLNSQIVYLEAHPEIDIVASRCLLIDGENRPSGILEFPAEHNEICKRPYSGILLPHPTWMGRTAWFRANPYRSPGPFFCEDQELLLRIYQNSRFHVIPKALLAYRVRGSIRLSKLIKTRVALGSLQCQHFMQRCELIFCFKSILITFCKISYDILSSLFFFRCDAGLRAVPLISFSAKEEEDWISILSDNPPKP